MLFKPRKKSIKRCTKSSWLYWWVSVKKKKFSDISDEFLNFINDKRLVIHNADFDIAHLNNELSILGKNKINNEIVDTLVLAREKFPGSQASLDALCKRYRIDNSKRVNHTALIDCELLVKVYINLIDQKEPTLNFQDLSQNTYKKNNQNQSYYKKVVEISPVDLEEHKKYLKNNLKKNFY